MVWTGSPNYEQKADRVSKLLERLPLKDLNEFDNENLSISDISTALTEAFDIGYAAGNLDTSEAFAEAEKKRRQGIIFVGDVAGMTHGASRLVGTIMENGHISTPAGSLTIEGWSEMGWKIDYIVPPVGVDDDEEDDDE